LLHYSDLNILNIPYVKSAAGTAGGGGRQNKWLDKILFGS
jgi:hypothetical protein